MEFFLRAKHWQVFMMLGPPIAMRLVVLVYFGIVGEPLPHVQLVMTIANGISIAGYSVWAFVIAKFINQKLPAYLQLDIRLFMVSLYANFVFITTLSVISIVRQFTELPPDLSDMVRTIVGPKLGFGYLSTYITYVMILYQAYVLSKIIATEEKQEQVLPGGYFGTLLLFIFAGIGVWWIQPRINRIFAHENFITNTPLDHNLDQNRLQ